MGLLKDVLPSGIPVIGDFINMGFTAQQNKKNREFAEEQAQNEFDRNVQMWQMQNEYNSPSAQMQRFKDAGLNPHLIYGQGNPGNASQLPKYNAPTWTGNTPQTDLLSMLSLYQDIKIKQQQRDNIFFDTQLKSELHYEKQLSNFLGQGEMDYLLETGANKGTRFGDFSRTMIEEKLRAARLKNDQILESKGFTKWQRLYAREKYEAMRDHRINIDKDRLWERILEKVIKNNSIGIRRGIKSLWKN